MEEVMEQDLAALAIECRTAADTLADMRTFQTGQGILRQAADALEVQAAEIARLTHLFDLSQKTTEAVLDRAEKAEAALAEANRVAIAKVAEATEARMKAEAARPLRSGGEVMADIDRNALAALIEAVEAGTATRAAIEEMGFAALPKMVDGVNCGSAYNGSIDAAKALHEALLPGWFVDIRWWTAMNGGAIAEVGNSHNGKSENPARAWLLAILRALAAEGDDADPS